MDTATYQDRMTLDEIAENDIAMTEYAIKNANRYNFGGDARKALLFVKEAMDKTLRRLGITVNPPRDRSAVPAYTKALDTQMAEKRITIEHRNKYRSQEVWRNGIYIMQADELVAFISDVLTERRTEFSPLCDPHPKYFKEERNFMVITNARMDEGQRIFLMH